MFDQSVHDAIKRKNRIFALSVAALTVVFVVLRMILTEIFINHDFYETDNILVLSVDYIIAASIVAIYAVSFFIYKHKKENHKYAEILDCFVQGTQAQVFSAALTGFLFVASAVFQGYSFITMSMNIPEHELDHLKELPFMQRVIEYMQQYPFDFAIFFLAVLSAVYFFKTAAMNFDIGGNAAQPSADAKNKNENPEDGENEENDPDNIDKILEEQRSSKPGISGHKFTSAHIMFSFMPIIWSFLNVFKDFFDMSKSVNSPVRVYELMSFLALSVYFVSESRMLVDRRESSRFFTFAYIAVILTAVSSLPNLIWSSYWMFEPNNSQIVYAVELALVVYILSRVYSQIRYGRFMLQR